jgi:hypothetical protein
MSKHFRIIELLSQHFTKQWHDIKCWSGHIADYNSFCKMSTTHNRIGIRLNGLIVQYRKSLAPRNTKTLSIKATIPWYGVFWGSWQSLSRPRNSFSSLGGSEHKSQISYPSWFSSVRVYRRVGSNGYLHFLRHPSNCWGFVSFISGPTTLLLSPGLFFGSVIFFTQSVGLLGRVTSPSQGRYLHTNRHPCLEWDSNPWSQRSNERRQFML